MFCNDTNTENQTVLSNIVGLVYFKLFKPCGNAVGRGRWGVTDGDQTPAAYFCAAYFR